MSEQHFYKQDKITITIRDTGPGFNPSNLPHAAQEDDPIKHMMVRETLGIREGGFGILMSQGLVDEMQYNEAVPTPAASLPEHLAEFKQMWLGMDRKWNAKLSPTEREKFDSLSENDRDVFRILRNWSQTDSNDFRVHCRSLGNRLGVTLKTAANIRRRFCCLGIMCKSAEYVPHKLAARFRWIAHLKDYELRDHITRR